MQHLGDPDDGHFVIVGDQLNPCFGHARSAHAEKLRAGAGTQRGSEAGGVHVAGSFSGGEENS